jgi:hypothetical protein
MNHEQPPGDDAKLRELLRTTRVSPPLPPRFQENVWRRIEGAVERDTTGSWLHLLATMILRPRVAFALATVLLLAGALAGTRAGAQAARQDAQARYVAYVAPNPLR